MPDRGLSKRPSGVHSGLSDSLQDKLPSHRAHDSASLALACTLLYAGMRQDHFVEGLLMMVGAVSTIYLSADLDNSYSMSRLRLTRRFGLVGQAWCTVYDRLFRHRGLSHVPVIGTLTRLTWLGLPLAILAFLCYLSPPPMEWWQPVVWWVGGLMLADMLHTVMDWVCTAVKRRRPYHGRHRRR